MKINNKGFAISVMLYGLLIIAVLTTSVLLQTMSFTRNTSKEFSDETRSGLEDNTTDSVGPSIYLYAVKIDQTGVVSKKTKRGTDLLVYDKEQISSGGQLEAIITLKVCDPNIKTDIGSFDAEVEIMNWEGTQTVKFNFVGEPVNSCITYISDSNQVSTYFLAAQIANYNHKKIFIKVMIPEATVRDTLNNGNDKTILVSPHIVIEKADESSYYNEK